MAGQCPFDDTAGKLLAMERQAGCLAEYLRRGDIELARWLLCELKRELCQIDNEAGGKT